MSEQKWNLEELKLSAKEHNIKLSVNKPVVILKPSKKYIKEYGDGDEQKAIDDLARWYGLIGCIEGDSVIMQVKEE